MDSMKDALMKRRSQGMDLSILVDGKQIMQGTVQPDDKNTDLAPPPDQGEQMDEMPSQEEGDDIMSQELGNPEQTEFDAQQKPKSLGDRAKMEMMKRQMTRPKGPSGDMDVK